MNKYLILVLLAAAGFAQCDKETGGTYEPVVQELDCSTRMVVFEEIEGCDGQVYPNPDTSKYRLPFETGLSYPMGLSNCSASYHSPGQPDQYAFDFDMPEGDKFRAARGGVVERVIEDRSSNGGGGGNFVSIDHEDGTFGLYLHSPQDGIFVEVGDRVKQGDVLGESGRSGLAGYPHLHFIVVKGSSAWPWDGMPISFRNAIPADIVLQSGRTYKACN